MPVGEGFGPAGERFVGGDRDRVLLFAFGKDLEEQFGASAVQFHVAKFVYAEQIHTAIAGDGLRQNFHICGFNEFVHEPGSQSVFDLVSLLGGSAAEPDEQMGFAGTGVADKAQG